MRKFEEETFIGVEELAEILGISRSSAYEFVKEAPFTIVQAGKKGKLIRIPVKAFYAWVDTL